MGEIAHIATRDQVFNGFRLGPDNVSAASELLDQCGYERSSVTDGKFAAIRFYYYWHNVAAGINHSKVIWAVIPEELAVEMGEFVKVEIVASEIMADGRCPIVRRIHPYKLMAGQCGFAKDPIRDVVGLTGLISIISIGPPGSASIYCPGLEEDGWKKEPIGFQDAIRWTKSPIK